MRTMVESFVNFMSEYSAAVQTALSLKYDISSIIAALTKSFGNASPVYSSKYCAFEIDGSEMDF